MAALFTSHDNRVPGSAMTPSAVPVLRRTVPRIALVLAMALVFVLLTSLLDGGKGVLPLRLLDQPRFPIANAWPGLLLAGLLLVTTRRLLLSFGLAYLLQGLIYGISTLKAANLGTPLLPADFRMAGQLRKGGFHLLAGYLPHSPWPYLAMLAGVLVLVAMWRLEPPLFARRTGGRRLAAGSVLALLLGSLLGGWSGWAKIYNGHVLWLEPWSAASTRVHAGLLSELVMFHLQYSQQKPKPDRAIAEQLIGQIQQGAPFAGVARQFSSAPTAANGGDGGWVLASEKPPEVAAALEKSLGEPESVKAIWKPQNTVPVDAEKGETLMRLINVLEDDDDVQNVYANFDMTDEVAAKISA